MSKRTLLLSGSGSGGGVVVTVQPHALEEFIAYEGIQCAEWFVEREKPGPERHTPTTTSDASRATNP